MSTQSSPDNAPTDVCDLIEEHRDVFERIAEHADDPEVAEQFGRKPLRHLANHGEGGEQSC